MEDYSKSPHSSPPPYLSLNGLMTESLDLISLILNGPLTCIVAILGIIFNLITIRLLNFRKNRAKKKYDQYKKHAGGQLLKQKSRLEGKIANRKESNVRKISSIKAPKKHPRIYLYLLWILSIDTVLLLSTLMNYGVPTCFHTLYDTVYAYFLPYWQAYTSYPRHAPVT